MSRQTDDIINRIEGTATALQGAKVKLSPPSPTGPPSTDVGLEPAPSVSQEDYAWAMKLAQDLEAEAKDLQAEISRESKVPEPPPVGAAGEPKSTEEHKTKSKTT